MSSFNLSKSLHATPRLIACRYNTRGDTTNNCNDLCQEDAYGAQNLFETPSRHTHKRNTSRQAPGNQGLEWSNEPLQPRLDKPKGTLQYLWVT